MSDVERRKFEEFYAEDYGEEEEPYICAEGFSEDEWCNPELRLGIEYCEFCCPFNRLDAVYERMRERREEPKK